MQDASVRQYHQHSSNLHALSHALVALEHMAVVRKHYHIIIGSTQAVGVVITVVPVVFVQVLALAAAVTALLL